MKSQVLHTVWCYISTEAAGEVWNWSLLGVKGLIDATPGCLLKFDEDKGTPLEKRVLTLALRQSEVLFSNTWQHICHIRHSRMVTITAVFYECGSTHAAWSKLWKKWSTSTLPVRAPGPQTAKCPSPGLWWNSNKRCCDAKNTSSG